MAGLGRRRARPLASRVSFLCARQNYGSARGPGTAAGSDNGGVLCAGATGYAGGSSRGAAELIWRTAVRAGITGENRTTKFPQVPPALACSGTDRG